SGAPNAYWTGEMVSKGTWEIYGGKAVNVVASFRAYDSVYSFYKDQDLLLARSRYAPVRAATTPAGQCWAFYMCGYATDPDYAAKLISIIKLNGLIQYDETGIVEEEDEEMTKEEKAAFEELKAKVAELAGRQSMDTIPEWAMEAAVAAKKAGIVDTTAGGSYDFYRVLTILHRKGLI
ncbi:muramidase (flagellum-specific), partial [Paenibacillus sepulcri]|nr:muramidase (flagellum-specific) [Paenibacillus sepulcri]